MARQSAIWNEWLQPPAPSMTRGVRVTLSIQDGDDSLAPFSITFKHETTVAPGFISTAPIAMTPVGSSRFVAQFAIPVNVYSDGGNVQYSILDSSGEWGGDPDFAGYCVIPAAGNNVTGYVPLRGPGAYTVKSFPKLNMIAIEAGRFRVSDLDFINVQALSMAQAAAKARRIAALTDLNGTLILQTGGIESAALPSGRFKDAMNEIARVIEFATEEVRNQQKFDVTNLELVRYL